MSLKQAPDPKTIIYRDDNMKADPDFVAQLMDCVESQVGEPSDKRRIGEGLPISVLEGRVVRDSRRFIPPRRLLKNGGTTIREEQIRTWRLIANLILFQAQQEAFSERQMVALGQQSRVGIENVRAGFDVGANQQNAYYDIHALEIDDDDEASREVADISETMRKNLQRAVEGTLRNREKMEEILHAANIFAKLTMDVVFKDIIDRLERIRLRHENPADTKRTFAMLNSVLKKLATAENGSVDPDFDVEIEALPVRDAVLYACQGLYTAERNDADGAKKAKIGIPMSVYGTAQMRSRREKLEIFAHELGHHLSLKKPLAGKEAGGDDPHDGQHEHWEDKILRAVEAMDFNWKDGSATMPEVSPKAGGFLAWLTK